MSWTDERIATLKKMWEGGATASQIADELGGVSRNAVIGKAHRLGLKSRPSPVKANEPKKADKAPAAKAAPKKAPAAPRQQRDCAHVPADSLETAAARGGAEVALARGALLMPSLEAVGEFFLGGRPGRTKSA